MMILDERREDEAMREKGKNGFFKESHYAECEIAMPLQTRGETGIGDAHETKTSRKRKRKRSCSVLGTAG